MKKSDKSTKVETRLSKNKDCMNYLVCKIVNKKNLE